MVFKPKNFPGFGGWFKDHAYSEEDAQTPDDVMHTANVSTVKFSLAIQKYIILI